MPMEGGLPDWPQCLPPGPWETRGPVRGSPPRTGGRGYGSQHAVPLRVASAPPPRGRAHEPPRTAATIAFLLVKALSPPHNGDITVSLFPPQGRGLSLSRFSWVGGTHASRAPLPSAQPLTFLPLRVSRLTSGTFLPSAQPRLPSPPPPATSLQGDEPVASAAGLGGPGRMGHVLAPPRAPPQGAPRLRQMPVPSHSRVGLGLTGVPVTTTGTYR